MTLLFVGLLFLLLLAVFAVNSARQTICYRTKAFILSSSPQPREMGADSNKLQLKPDKFSALRHGGSYNATTITEGHK
jgi:hypothetical protein